MYFIPRNNTFYHYIAHMNSKNRYACTGFFVLFLVLMAFYFMQRFINVYTIIYEQERAALLKKHQDIERITHKNKQLSAILAEIKKELQEQMYAGAIHDYFKKRLLFVLDMVKQSDLKLHSYGVQKEHNYGWYIKEKAHIDITGTLQQLMHFFEVIKQSRQMISVVQWTVMRYEKDEFRAQCDVEFILLLPIT